ncbi:MAG: copper chaperone PCu(A)C [Candidatus Eisenbacteria bacterium]
MSRGWTILALLALLGASGCSRNQHTAPASEGAAVQVAVSDFHAMATPEGATVGAIFGTLVADAADTLVAVSVPAEVAGRAEIHEMVADSSGQMSMRAVPALALPEDQALELRPGGLHLMLFDLVAPLRPERPVSLTLRFARGGERVVEVPVREL